MAVVERFPDAEGAVIRDAVDFDIKNINRRRRHKIPPAFGIDSILYARKGSHLPHKAKKAQKDGWTKANRQFVAVSHPLFSVARY
ncbi:hypothetical protein [Paenibacillus elgii]|uniref:hypothetical protein n=1 Tax=Paenibacillus elgii TaxID=189691 RepID=UPI0016765943|nr:hypothetical protein [Paenibacillus elgii]